MHPDDEDAWQQLKLDESSNQSLTWTQHAKRLAFQWLLGATLHESSFTVCTGGPGRAHVDVLYQDATLKIARGHKGTLFCHTKVK